MPLIAPLSNSPQMGGRILSLDLARGFTVLIMPSVHVVMLYSQPQIQQSLLGIILQFLAEGPGAQLFMLIMGISITLSKTLSTKKVLQRTICLFIGAFALNIFKFVIPLELGLIPDLLTRDVPLSTVQFILLGDIFHFAAIAYPITYFISKLRYSYIWSLLFATAIMLLSPLVWDVRTGLKFVDQVLIYFNGHPPFVFFPIFPWLVYPLIGLAIARVLQTKKIALAGAIIIIISLLFPATTEYTTFYRTRPADTIFHISIVLLWLSLFDFISRKVKPNFFFMLLKFCSRNITLIYILQWLLIFWCLSFAGYQDLGFTQTIYWMFFATITTLLLTYAIKKSI